MSTWENAFIEEVMTAIHARQVNNDGMARVCCRRALGIVKGEYFSRTNIPDPGSNVFQRISRLQQQLPIDEEINLRLAHFSTKANKDYSFPSQIDLLEDTLWFANKLLGWEKQLDY